MFSRALEMPAGSATTFWRVVVWIVGSTVAVLVTNCVGGRLKEADSSTPPLSVRSVRPRQPATTISRPAATRIRPLVFMDGSPATRSDLDDPRGDEDQQLLVGV